MPDPQFWVLRTETSFPDAPYLFGFKDGVGNTVPIVSADWHTGACASLRSANSNTALFDYIARQKIQGQHLNWFIVEQLPVVRQSITGS